MPVVFNVLLTAGLVGVAGLLVSCGGSKPPPTPFPNSAAFPTALSTLAPATAVGGSATAETGSATPGASVTGTPGELTSTPNPAGSSTPTGLATGTPSAGSTIVAGASATPAAGGSASTSSYTVKSGDTLNSIARQYNVTAADLASANNISDPNTITIGQTLKIPPPSASTPAAGSSSSSAGTPSASSASSSGQSYTVQAGDTACKIATANKVTLSDLATANGTSVSALSNIRVGQVLKLPPPSATATSGC